MENSINNQHRTNNTKTIAGIVILGLGLSVLLKNAGFFIFPHFIFTWPVLLILLGVYSGSKHNFKNSGWIIITMLGVIFLLPNIIPSIGCAMLWPLLLIAFGVHAIMRHNQRWNGNKWEKRGNDPYQKFDNTIK